MLNHFAVAEALEAHGNIDAAIDAYTDALDLQQDRTNTLIRRSALLREQGELQAAERDLVQAAALSPDNPWPMMRLGQLAGASGRNVTEAQHKQAALDRAPDNFEMRVNAAAAYTQLRWLDLAANVARTLPEGLPDWWGGTRHNALSLHRALRREARDVLRSRRGPHDRILVTWELTQKLFSLGRLALAKRLCESLMREIPSSFPAFFFYSRILCRTDGPAAAVDFLRQLAWLHRDAEEYPYALARVLHECGDFAGVLQITSGLSVAQEPEELRYIKGVALLMLERRDELRRYCRAWLSHSPMSVAPAGFITAAAFRASAPATHVPARAARTTIVQFWDTPEVPGDVAEVMQTWTAHHPHTQRILFDEAAARTFLSNQIGSNALDLFDKCHHAAMKADYFRIAYLLHHGGVWIDADERCLQPMDHVLLPGAASDLAAPLSGDTPGYLHNFFLACRPASPIMRFALAEAEREVSRAFAEQIKPDIWQLTGPGLITRAAAHHIGDSDESANVLLLSLHQYRVLAQTEGGLAYKTKRSGNWQLA